MNGTPVYVSMLAILAEAMGVAFLACIFYLIWKE